MVTSPRSKQEEAMNEAKTRRPPILRIVVALIAVAGCAFGYMWWRAQRAKPKAPRSYAGNVDIRDVTLSFRVGGRVEMADRREGDRVRKGDVLARIDSEPYRIALAQAKSSVDIARAQLTRVKAGSRYEDLRELSAMLDQRKAAREQALETFGRVRQLAASGAVPAQSLTDAQAALDQSEANVRAAQASLARATNGARPEDVSVSLAQLTQAEATAEAAELSLRDCELRSAVDGVVVTRSLEPGQMLGVGAPTFVIAIDDPVWVRGFAPETDLAFLAPGTAVDVFTDAHPGKAYRGQVGYVATQSEFTPKNVETAELRTSLVYRFRVIVTEHDDGLRQGMPVTMRVVGAVSSAGGS